MAAKRPVEKRFGVRIEIEGAMLGKDTPISEQAIIDLLEMQFAGSKTYKVVRIEAKEA